MTKLAGDVVVQAQESPDVGRETYNGGLVQENGCVVVRNALDKDFLQGLLDSSVLEVVDKPEPIFNQKQQQEINNPHRFQHYIMKEESHGEVRKELLGPDLILQAALHDAQSRGLVSTHLTNGRRVVLCSSAKCKEQLPHTDYDGVERDRHDKFEAPQDERQSFPLSLLVSLQDRGKLVVPKQPPIVLNQGDYAVFGPDFKHAGAAYNLPHFRLFSYLVKDGFHVRNQTNFIGKIPGDWEAEKADVKPSTSTAAAVSTKPVEKAAKKEVKPSRRTKTASV